MSSSILAMTKRQIATKVEPALGWAILTEFGKNGARWDGVGPSLRGVAINPERGTGSSVQARLELLRQAINDVPPEGPTLYFTAAGFFGCRAERGDKISDLAYSPMPELADLPALIGEIAAALPENCALAVGVDELDDDAFQSQWWFKGGSPDRIRHIYRCTSRDINLQHRIVSIGEFSVIGFLCGELWDRGRAFDYEKDSRGIDIVIDLAHASINRTWDGAVRPKRRCAFQRTFFDIRSNCGAMLAQAHDKDTASGLVRRQQNWIVFKGEFPFPKNGYRVTRLG